MNYRSLSTPGKIVMLIFLVLATIPFIYLGFGWSLSQTIMFCRLLFPTNTDAAGMWLGIGVQFSPNVFLLIASRSESKNEKLIWRIIAITVSLFDGATNMGARVEQTAVYNYKFVIGLFLDFGITWAEELIAIFISAVFEIVADIFEDFGGTAPSWLRMASGLSRAAGTSTNRSRSKRKRNSNNRSRGGGRNTSSSSHISRDYTQQYDLSDNRYNPPDF